MVKVGGLCWVEGEDYGDKKGRVMVRKGGEFLMGKGGGLWVGKGED